MTRAVDCRILRCQTSYDPKSANVDDESKKAVDDDRIKLRISFCQILQLLLLFVNTQSNEAGYILLGLRAGFDWIHVGYMQYRYCEPGSIYIATTE